jgi:hypothetical protein
MRIHTTVVPRALLVLAIGWSLAPVTLAEMHPIVPAFSSRPGAPYTLYLNFGGFNFNGNWGNSPGSTPGNTPAYTVDFDATTFSPGEVNNIQGVWSRVAEMYSPFDVNVTTVDPAPLSLQDTDAYRQQYYDSIPRLMHTVIGGSGGWSGGGGVSYVGVAASAQTGSNGYHTNWVFSAQSPTSLQFVAVAAGHEDGHGLGLWHQSNYSGTTLIDEYSLGTGVGVGSQAPIMGNGYYAQRAQWKRGTAHIGAGPVIQNDAQIMALDQGMGGFIDDGVGHDLGTATPLPLSGEIINATLAKGVIVPASETTPNPTLFGNYLSDYWAFTTGAGTVALSLTSGRSTMTPNQADAGAMLNATLTVLNSGGVPIASSSSGILNETLVLNLPAGSYYAQISSAGDPQGLGFYDMGSYFLTGFIAPVPEPSTLVLAAFAAIGLYLCRRAG